VFDRPHKSFGIGVGVSCRLHRQRAGKHKPFASLIRSIRCVGVRFTCSIAVRRGARTVSTSTTTRGSSPGSRSSGPMSSLTIRRYSSGLAGPISAMTISVG
jgi:hypothetical protein